MARIKTRLPKGGTLILLWIGAILLLGAVGWGIGWLVPRVLAPGETPTSTPTQMARPTATPTMAPAPTLASTTPEATGVPPTIASTESAADPATQPSAEPTVVPEVEPTPGAEESEVVQSGDGLFQVCRRHCPERWPPDDDDLTVYAQQVAELNGLSWPDPALSLDQVLKMPPCPKK